MSPNRTITLRDVVCREGEQRPGRSYTVDQTVAAATALDDLGVPFVQVGFPATGPETSAVCDRLDTDAALVGIARAIEEDIEAAAAAGVDVIEVFAPTSERQRSRLLGVDAEELQSRVAESVDRARETGCPVHFSAMDGFRSVPGVLDELFAAVDADRYTIADTVGGMTPAEVVAFIDQLTVPAERIGVHCHDDIDLATANALAAVTAGVGSVDVAAGGVGERAGNTPLESLVVALDQNGAADHGIERERLVPCCRETLAALGEEIPATASIIGSESFTHESGLHVAAMLEEPATFEAFDPSLYGEVRKLRFGSQTGRGAARRVLERAGREPTDERVTALLTAFRDANGTVGLERALEMARQV